LALDPDELLPPEWLPSLALALLGALLLLLALSSPSLLA
jgi:hypothetical protein